MVKCDGPKTSYCHNACCYIIRKEITEGEAHKLGLENVVTMGDNYYLQNKERSDACVFLNETDEQCSIYEDRPLTCRLYSCVGQDLVLLAQEAAHQRKRLAKKTI